MKWVTRLAIAFAALLAAVVALDRIFPPPLEKGETVSAMVSDREGRPLRAIPTPDHYWRFKAELDEIDPVFIEALLEVEDQRFWGHHGVDWTGMVRAVWTSAKAGRIVSGGSTITMQTARLLEPRAHDPLQTDRDVPRPPDRSAAVQGGNPRALSHADALWRQYRGHPRGELALFRPLAGPAFR